MVLKGTPLLTLYLITAYTPIRTKVIKLI